MSSRPSKIRIDQLLVDRGLYESRARAQAALMARDVRVGGAVVTQAGKSVAADAIVECRAARDLVGRGALKIEPALRWPGFDPAGLVCLDIGASTGGFTQMLLARGASKVYAVDVGYGQLDYRLRGDKRVVVMERVNARNLKPGDLPVPASFFTMDVSFISIFKILPVMPPLLTASACGVALFKPNFEAKRGEVGRGGILRDPDILRRLLADAPARLEAAGFYATRLEASPVAGADGNREFLFGVSLQGPAVVTEQDVDRVLAMI